MATMVVVFSNRQLMFTCQKMFWFARRTQSIEVPGLGQETDERLERYAAAL